MLVYPDPETEQMRRAHEEGTCPNFYQYARLPQWDTEYLCRRIAQVRGLGAENTPSRWWAATLRILSACCALPPLFQPYGATVEEIFAELPDLRALYGKEADGFSTGAIGVFSYLTKSRSVCGISPR